MMQRRFIHPDIVVLSMSIVAIIACSNSATVDGSAETENSNKAKAIEQYLADNFGMPGYETSWYDNITGVSVRGSTVELITNLVSKNEKASNICVAASGFVFSNENRSYGLSNVQVDGQNGQILINRRGISDRCS